MFITAQNNIKLKMTLWRTFVVKIPSYISMANSVMTMLLLNRLKPINLSGFPSPNSLLARSKFGLPISFAARRSPLIFSRQLCRVFRSTKGTSRSHSSYVPKNLQCQLYFILIIQISNMQRLTGGVTIVGQN